MAQGVIEMKETHPIDQQTEHSIQYFLHRFYMSRISIRMLINQHAVLFGGDVPGHSRHVGVVDPNCDVSSVALDAYENARFLCDQYYMVSPRLIIDQHNVVNSDAPVSFTYVPSHLYHVLFELFKNALRAVVEHHQESDSDKLPPVRILVVKGREDMSIKISDQGGGIPRSLSDHLFHYMYSTAPKPSVSGDDSAPLAGYGYGLPLSRLYARYFHGDLVISSYEGYGTDCMVYLKLLSSEANERLPIFNKTSSKHYKSIVGSHDWSSGVSGSANNSSQVSSEAPVVMRH
jgi:pyruvate dehydrogenase kinase 2/3/4